jgi:hypothetical protein
MMSALPVDGCGISLLNYLGVRLAVASRRLSGKTMSCIGGSLCKGKWELQVSALKRVSGRLVVEGLFQHAVVSVYETPHTHAADQSMAHELGMPGLEGSPQGSKMPAA